MPTACGPAWRDAIAGAQLTTLQGAGHVAASDQPLAFVDTVAGFLDDGTVITGV